MVGMGKHINRLNSRNPKAYIQDIQIARLCCRITTDIDDFFGCGVQNSLNYVGMHSSTRRIRNNKIRPTVLFKKLVAEQILHIAGQKQGV